MAKPPPEITMAILAGEDWARCKLCRQWIKLIDDGRLPDTFKFPITLFSWTMTHCPVTRSTQKPNALSSSYDFSYHELDDGRKAEALSLNNDRPRQEDTTPEQDAGS